MLEDRGDDDGEAAEEEAALEENAVEFLNGFVLVGFAVAKEGNEAKEEGDEAKQGGQAELGGDHVLTIEAVSGALGGEIGSAKDDGDGEVGKANDGSEDLHGLVEVAVFTEQANHREVGEEDNDDKENHEDDNDKGHIDVGGEVGRGQTIEPKAIEEAEDGEEITDTDVAAKGFLNGKVIVLVGHAFDRMEEALKGKEGSGQTKAAKEGGKAIAHIRKRNGRALTDPKIRGNEEAKPNAEEAKACEQEGEEHDIDETDA